MANQIMMEGAAKAAPKGGMMLVMNIDALETAMFRRRWTSKHLAAVAGLHENTLYMLRAGKSQPSLETVSLLAKALEINPFTLLKDDAGH